MPRMRNKNGAANIEVKGVYIYCNKKRNKPRVHHKVCESKCRFIKKCKDYDRWHELNFGKKSKQDEPKKKVRKPRKKVKRKTRKTKTKAKKKK